MGPDSAADLSPTGVSSAADPGPATEGRRHSPDGHPDILQLFSVGGSRESSASADEERQNPGPDDKDKTAKTRQKRFSGASKVGHSAADPTQTQTQSSQDKQQNKPSSPPATEKYVADSTPGKTRRSARYIWVSLKRKLGKQRGGRETSVKEIHIPPEEGEDKWANRSFNDNSNSNSNSNSSASSRAGSSGSRRQGVPGLPGDLKEKATLDAIRDSRRIEEKCLQLFSPENSQAKFADRWKVIKRKHRWFKNFSDFFSKVASEQRALALATQDSSGGRPRLEPSLTELVRSSKIGTLSHRTREVVQDWSPLSQNSSKIGALSHRTRPRLERSLTELVQDWSPLSQNSSKIGALSHRTRPRLEPSLTELVQDWSALSQNS
ncbi:hypothetical protein EGW08_007339 [Elysia chlorotica]|uniref:Uncharacterized protein n=1 Tax=Elysia chlorotica TaxID=188477 RepID=A0A3S0ZR93_ELYCH|nr:hypothetical protein EGW08_007339 [Elysia chlorotica]